jgi:GTP-binding protein Era
VEEDCIEFGRGRVGFVTIVGRPNVGKSTFINKALGYHLTAVSTRPNTTRKRWLGILSDKESQIIFSDTPGVHFAKNRMHEAMANTVIGEVNGGDAILCLCDATREFGDEDRRVAQLVRRAEKPVVLVINKMDTASEVQAVSIAESFQAIMGDVSVFRISALTGEGIDSLLDHFRQTLPEGPFLFPDDQLTDVIEREISEEVIREAANELMRQELPQEMVVKIDDWAENEKKIKIAATIYVERDSQKAIVIGEKGQMVNRVIKSAREKLRVDLGKFVDLKLSVKVIPDWQNKKCFLREKGIVDPAN